MRFFQFWSLCRMASNFVFWQVSILIGKSLVKVLLSAGTDQGISVLWIANCVM